jgi:uncharacterized protein
MKPSQTMAVPVFKPAWWLRNGHLQTIYPALWRRIKRPPQLHRERLATRDGDFIDVDWCGAGSGPLVILLHGLTGSSRSGYIAGLQSTLHKQGVRSVTLNFRGCSGEPNNLARSYHAGETEDLSFLYHLIREREPDIVLSAVGFSLGGNVLLKWLGEQGSNIGLKAAVAVCVPLLLSECANKLDKGVSRMYRNRLIKELKGYVVDKQRTLMREGRHAEAEKILRIGSLASIQSFWQYDDKVVAALHGFENVRHYYDESSSRRYLRDIKVPTLLIQAKDDPFMTKAVLPLAAELSASVILELTQGGGHVGFVTGSNPFKPLFWLEQRIPAFLASHFDTF